MSAELHAQITSTIHEFFNGYIKAAEASDASLLSTNLSPTCTRRVAPAGFLASLGMPPDLAFTNEQYEAKYAQELPVSRPTKLDALGNIVVDVIKKTAAATVAYSTEFCDGEQGRMEFAWFFELDEEGKVIERMTEFVDTAGAAAYQKRVEQLLKATK